MLNPKAYIFETKNFDCEFQIPPEDKEPFEIMLTNFGWHFTFAMKPKELKRFIRFLNKSSKQKKCVD